MKIRSISKHSYFLAFCYILAGLGVLLALFFKAKSKIYYPQSSILVKQSPSAFMALMTGNKRVSLLEMSYNIWMKKILNQKYVSSIVFYGIGNISTDNDDIKKMYFDTPVFAHDKSWNKLVGKMYYALKHFLNNTRSDWLLRLCDDAWLNFPKFHLFFNDLNDNYDPLKDVVIQGNSIFKTWKGYAYLQGGSGYVLSRRAAKILFDDFETYMNISQRVNNDDSALGIYLRNKNIIPANNLSNRFFVGHSFTGTDNIKQFMSTLPNLGKCPNLDTLILPGGTRKFFSRVKNVVFWHDRVKYYKFIPHAAEYIDAIPNNIFFYNSGQHPTACIGTETTKEGYFD